MNGNSRRCKPDALTLEEVGQAYGLSRERIHQIERKLLQELAEHDGFKAAWQLEM